MAFLDTVPRYTAFLAGYSWDSILDIFLARFSKTLGGPECRLGGILPAAARAGGRWWSPRGANPVRSTGRSGTAPQNRRPGRTGDRPTSLLGRNLFRQGAVQGRSTRQVYFVKCDGKTATQNDIDPGM